jgi:CAAX protease family protein
MKNSSRPFPVFAFFFLVYLFSWLIWIPLLLSHNGIGPFHVSEDTSNLVRLFGVLVPSTLAIVLTAWSGGRKALAEMLGRLKIWRVGWRWWVAAVLVFPALLVTAALLYNLFGGNPPVKVNAPVSTSVLLINIIALTLATFGEEIGWRGAALPALQKKYNPLVASLILGFLWASWHLPFWLLQDTIETYGIGYFGLNYLGFFPLTFYITWFFNHTRYSLLLPVAFHLSFNLVNVVILPVTSSPGAFAVFVGMIWVVALLLLPDLKKQSPQIA